MPIFPKRKRKDLTADIVVYANDLEANAKFKYKKNEIRTTKYTLLTFLPKNMFEQFRRLPNFYFLIAALLSILDYIIPGISPTDPLSSIVPFFLIIATAAFKEAFEDFKRWQSDNELNNRVFEKVDGKKLSQTLNKEISVGDILHLKEDQEVPADCVILSTSHEDGLCFVETANLDGETNLKQFRAFEGTKKFSDEQMQTLRAKIRCEQPHRRLYEFKGNIIVYPDDWQGVIDNPLGEGEEELTPLGDKQLLMRGVTIRNTKWVYCLVVYTGKKTKLALNQVSPPSKMSTTEKTLNSFAVVVFVYNMATVIIGTLVSAQNEASINGRIWYSPITSTLSWDGGVVFMAYFILFTYFIPLSLFVNLELMKLFHAGFMMADDDMKHNDKGMRVKNSNLNDELSRVAYVFSDKTGTLTENKMVFDACTVDGKKYAKAGQGQLKDDCPQRVHSFFLHMALNHEVIPEDRGEEMPHFAAPTPDEIALVKGAFINGVQLCERSSKTIKVKITHTIDGQPPKDKFQEYELLESLEFSSERKRSSIILKTPEGRIIMFTKGADSIMKKRLSKSVPAKTLEILDEHLEEYSKIGLRTLVFSTKELTKDEFATFRKQYKAAGSAIDNRKQLMEDVMDQIEQDLDLQGCSAILDKLQDGVPSTIHYLIKSGIKVWMITGDKQETAENIGNSCKLISEATQLVRVVKSTDAKHCKAQFESARKTLMNGKVSSLVIDGDSMNFAFLPEIEPLFLEVGMKCESVICCRAAPIQKALVVRMMKRGTKKVTLSIGDGANDVSMIQEAHIGVGIRGEEGTQAERASDYAIQRFRHLSKLVTVHGRYNMLRAAIMIEYSFYKNLAMFTGQFWFGIFNMFSASSFFDDWAMAAYNTLLLALPPLALALFEKDLHEEDIKKNPQVFKEMQQGIYLTKTSFIIWLISAFYQSLVFFFSVFLLPETLNTLGWTPGILALSTFVASSGIVAIILRGALVTKHWVFVNHLFYWLSIVGTFLFLIIESNWDLFITFAGVMNFVLSTGHFYFYFLWVVVASLFPDLAVAYIQRSMFPYLWQIVQEKEALKKKQGISDEPEEEDDTTLGKKPEDYSEDTSEQDKKKKKKHSEGGDGERLIEMVEDKDSSIFKKQKEREATSEYSSKEDVVTEINSGDDQKSQGGQEEDSGEESNPSAVDGATNDSSDFTN